MVRIFITEKGSLTIHDSRGVQYSVGIYTANSLNRVKVGIAKDVSYYENAPHIRELPIGPNSTDNIFKEIYKILPEK